MIVDHLTLPRQNARRHRQPVVRGARPYPFRRGNYRTPALAGARAEPKSAACGCVTTALGIARR